MPERIGPILDCALLRWSPRIGDPSVVGWTTVALYFGTAALAAKVVGRSRVFPAETRRRERLFWMALCALLLGMGVNKQLDLQSLLTAIGRCVAQLDGWYAERRATQARFIAALLAAALAGAVASVLLLRGALRRQAPALFGAMLLVAFVVVRAVGFHHVDAFISTRVSGWRMNWILEIGGIALVALGALWALSATRGSSARATHRRDHG
ncbi:MAG: isopropylmalate isomerase [Rhodobacterales bacterium CG18_big_fil_WC_8_21_14_2_50_71_9]|nr:MAG: isopropylmalate isomerase [Rhodobacterales bacterium CG18_big_fil_WC_8_21_14_2_50_71_9]PIY73228.1 MAG: isopropylmalate isomerase [Rhodobacterales bacterium CG_4_10_14_0_8_um_filter_70_9]PJA60836.1 MAG: isopropylmalate isomerase [Rhodobacterales bacterium CG_4_9_14_3_um_filter_71_31]